jgi:DNA-binding protein HU-beta
LVGFGSFLPVARKAGLARNPRTGATVNRPASKTTRFRVGESLKSALNG